MYCEKDFKQIIEETAHVMNIAGNIEDAPYWSGPGAQSTVSERTAASHYDKFAPGLVHKHEADFERKGATISLGSGKAPRHAKAKVRQGNRRKEKSGSMRGIGSSGSGSASRSGNGSSSDPSSRLPPEEMIDVTGGGNTLDQRLCLSKGIATLLRKQGRNMNRNDYSHKDVYFPDSKLGPYEFVVYAPAKFNGIRSLFGITPESFGVSTARRGSLKYYPHQGSSKSSFMASTDSRFFIKSISTSQTAVLMKILPSYFRHITRHQHTLLPRFFGLYSVKVSGKKPMRYLVMNNIFNAPVPMLFKFDVIGDQSRKISSAAARHRNDVLMEGNLTSKICIGEKQKHALVQQLSRDETFLRKHHLYGQSMLIGVNKSKAQAKSKNGSIESVMLMRQLFDDPHGK